MARRLCAILASTSEGMLASFVPRMMHRTLPMAVSRVTCVVTLFVAHNLGRACCGRRSERLGGLRATRRWYGDAPRGSRAVYGGPSSISGFRGVWPIALRMNDDAR